MPTRRIAWAAAVALGTGLTGIVPEFPIEAFENVDASVRESLDRVRRSPFIPHRDAVRGFVYDVDTHRLREVEAGD